MPYLRTGLVIALGLVSAGIALSQQTPAKENRGVVIKPVGVMELADEIEGMAGRQMRMRYITMEPGGEFALHSHKDRPTLEYVLAGTVIEYRDGEVVSPEGTSPSLPPGVEPAVVEQPGV